MTKDVLVSLTGFQYLQREGEPEPVEVMCKAQYYCKNGQHYVIYDEITEGYAEPTHSMLKFTENRLLVHKKGLINVEMLFERGKKTLATYQTPVGSLDMGISATYFQLKERPDEIDYRVDYALGVDERFLADCQIFVKIQSKGSEAACL